MAFSVTRSVRCAAPNEAVETIIGQTVADNPEWEQLDVIDFSVDGPFTVQMRPDALVGWDPTAVNVWDVYLAFKPILA